MGSIELEHDDSNVIPYAIMANWSALSKLSEELCSAVYHAAMSAEKRSTATRPGMSATALSRFIHVWEKVAADAAHPFFSVSPKGYIVAEWHNDPNNNLTLMFDGKGTVFYALFDADAPCEGFAENDAQYKNTINMFLSRTPNPFKW
ncbi:MAG: hypothetical protein O3A85_13155 [Proteobacteria bacterium]|nr:hypothetical protein [Pseudomonadota bacterium]